MNWVGPIAWNILDQMRWRFASFFVRVNSVNCWFGNGFWNNLQKTEGLVLWGIPKHGYCCDRLNWFKIHSIFSAVGSKTPSGSNSIWPPKARCSLLIWTPTPLVALLDHWPHHIRFHLLRDFIARVIIRVSHLQFFWISLLFQAGIYARHTKEQEKYRSYNIRPIFFYKLYVLC